jgi:hypothetical protein
VDDDAGGVEDAAEAGTNELLELGDSPSGDIRRLVAGENVFAGTRERPPGRLHDERPPVALGERCELGMPGQLVDGGQAAQRIRRCHAQKS